MNRRILPAFDRVVVENDVREGDVTRRVLERLPDGVPVEYVDDAAPLVRAHARRAGALARGKRTLLLQAFRGEAVKPCPATREYLCCQYQILNAGTGCPLDCSYCILQDYFSNPLTTVPGDLEPLLEAADRRLRAEPERFFRLGTGEFADSLALDPLTGCARRQVEWVRDFPNAVLELKTKSANVEEILQADHRGRTICAWSVNAAEVVAREEFRVASLEERLKAAARCEAAGYRLAFHFDPILHFPGWEEGYRRTVARIFDAVRPESVAWISLGCLRFPPGLETVIHERFPRSLCATGEFVIGGDGKLRYPQPLRVRIYRALVRAIRERAGERPELYFCMENPAVWRRVFGRAPCENSELARRLDAACSR